MLVLHAGHSHYAVCVCGDEATLEWRRAPVEMIIQITHRKRYNVPITLASYYYCAVSLHFPKYCGSSCVVIIDE